MNKIKYLHFLLCTLMAGLTSCLDDGEETFALEKGEVDELIETNWKISDCRLYDAENGVYHSELINDDLLGFIYMLDSDGINAVIEPDQSTRALSWVVNQEQHSLTLNYDTYTIESLGKELMVLSCHANVNGERYIKKYYLRNLGAIENIGEIEDPDENATYVVSTDGSGRFRRNGYVFTIPMGAVPRGDNGNSGSVAFSAQSVANENLPGHAPDGVEFVEGSGILANPTNFIFASPLVIDVPLRGHAAENTCLYRWNSLRSVWEIVPYSFYGNGSSARVSVIELGYFVLGVKHDAGTMGGIKINKSDFSDGYYYYLTLTPRDGNSSTSIAFSSADDDLYMANVPLGEYSATVTRERRAQLEAGVATIETATRVIGINVQTRLVPYGTSFSTYTGWTILDLTAIDWTEGRPDSWGDATVTYGTGTFQATLNWVNYSGSTTDYDLHLTTPDGTEIYYQNKSGDGFELDRDVISTIGNCTENIYSISESLPKGTYKVRVHHYGGAIGRSYNCRVILNGMVVSSYSGITNSGYQDIYNFTLQ